MSGSRYKDRQRSSTVVGTYTNASLISNNSHTAKLELNEFEDIRDSTSPKPYKDPNPFLINKNKDGVVRLSGKVTTRIFGQDRIWESWESYPISKLTPYFGIDHLSPLSGFAALAVDRATPSGNTVNFGEFVQGLVQLPRTIVQIKKLINNYLDAGIDSIGSAYLIGKFGLVPLINDLNLIVSAQHSLASNARNARRAHNEKSFRGTLYKNTEIDFTRYWYSSSFHKYSYDVKNEYDTKVWYSVRFSPSSSEGKVPNRLTQYASFFSLDKPLSTAWALFPWSFLIDYFIDISAFISNSESSFEVKDVCIMRHSKAVATVSSQKDSIIPTGLWTLSKDTLKANYRPGHVEKKQRAVFTSGKFVPIKFFLSSTKLTNISALLASRYGR